MFSMFLGKVLTHLFSVDVLNKVGGGILVLLGMWILYQFLSGRFISSERRKTLVKIEIKSIGLVINVLKTNGSRFR